MYMYSRINNLHFLKVHLWRPQPLPVQPCLCVSTLWIQGVHSGVDSVTAHIGTVVASRLAEFSLKPFCCTLELEWLFHTDFLMHTHIFAHISTYDQTDTDSCC